MRPMPTTPARENIRLLPRRHLDTWPAAIYAIGDVHGCLSQLRALEAAIASDAAGIAGAKWMVTLGDLVDRGPDSAGVIAHVLAPAPPGFTRICLRGNHEQMLLDFLADPDANGLWLAQGGEETLKSYGVRRALRSSSRAAALAKKMPVAHREFLETLPVLLTAPGWAFVHAGLRPGVALDRQDDKDLIWIRGPFLDGPPIPGLRVVHGHTLVDEPEVLLARINIDTGCFASGRLTAVRITPDGATRLLGVGP